MKRHFEPNAGVRLFGTLLNPLWRPGSRLLLCCVLAVQSGAEAASALPNGREIYRNLCAKCHGRNGEGVKDKHDGPLQGDRPLDKLTHYIERKMPEDHPGTCVGKDALAVAQYIYDSFYSREARLRKNPPRIDLVHLTKRQYANTVADLLKHFTGEDPPMSGDRGLTGTYYSARDFNADKKVLERIDHRIDFDFNQGDDHDKLAGTNGFSIQWRGALLADETGDYELVLKTPNGARLWVNDTTEPLIDAWVASGKVTEHKSVIRLLGGRAYPLRLDCFKFKEKSAAISLLWKPPRGVLEPIPARNLCQCQSSPTLVITTPFGPDDSSLGYERGMLVSKAWDEATTAAALEVAGEVARNLDKLSNSKSDATNRAFLVEGFCKEFIARAWRRPLTDAQTQAYVAAQFKAGINLEESVKRVVLLALKSPRFLYLGLPSESFPRPTTVSRPMTPVGGRPAANNIRRPEPTPQGPDDFEIASRLSYALWDSMPDPQLWKAALRGEIHTSQQVNEQARHMLSDARCHAKIQAFFHHWLQMDRVDNLSKDDKLFPGFTPAIIADLRTSLDLFVADVFWSAASDYRDLLQADYLFLNQRLAEFYGVGTNATDDFQKMTDDSRQRSGVLTHPYLLAMFSYQRMTSPIHRGVFLTRNIVGRSLKPPPMAMTFKDADFAPNLTMREKVSELTRSETCQACHSVINPLGFSLEQYDAVGRFRTSEKDRTIDPASDYVTDDGQVVRFNGARDVARFAISSEQAQLVFVEQLFHHLVKQPVLAYGADTLSRLRESFVASGFNMQKLTMEIVTLAALHGTNPAHRSILEKTANP